VTQERLAEAYFEQVAAAELQRMLDALLLASDELDPDLEMGVLSIHFDDDTKYVVNSHRAARQIWMAAANRAWHFDYQPDTETWTVGDEELWATLSEVLTRKLGSPVVLSPN